MSNNRQPKPDPDPVGNDVMYAYSMTTAPQREQIVEDWDSGQKIKHKRFADLLDHVNANALLLASLLEAGHESVCKPSGRPKCKHYGRLLKMALDYKPVHKPTTSENPPQTIETAFSQIAESAGITWMCL